MLSRAEIKDYAKQGFMNQYWPVVGYSLLSIVLMACAGMIGSWISGLLLVSGIVFFNVGAIFFSLASVTTMLITVLLSPPMLAGTCNIYTRAYRREQVMIDQLFSPFKRLGRVVGGYWWMYLWTFLWTLLFVIPGIIKAFAYSMTMFILADSPSVPATKALTISMKLTDGYKLDIFIFLLSFIGWQILNAITFGILGIFFVNPYFGTSFAGLYTELRRNAIMNGKLTEEEIYLLNH